MLISVFCDWCGGIIIIISTSKVVGGATDDDPRHRPSPSSSSLHKPKNAHLLAITSEMPLAMHLECDHLGERLGAQIARVLPVLVLPLHLELPGIRWPIVEHRRQRIVHVQLLLVLLDVLAEVLLVGEAGPANGAGHLGYANL